MTVGIPPEIPPWEVEHLFRAQSRDTASGVVFYATAGIFDPKAPVIDVPLVARATGLGYWAAYGAQIPFAIIGSLAIGLVFDPASKFDNWGVDEVWHHSHDSDFWNTPHGSV